MCKLLCRSNQLIYFHWRRLPLELCRASSVSGDHISLFLGLHQSPLQPSLPALLNALCEPRDWSLACLPSVFLFSPPYSRINHVTHNHLQQHFVWCAGGKGSRRVSPQAKWSYLGACNLRTDVLHPASKLLQASTSLPPSPTSPKQISFTPSFPLLPPERLLICFLQFLLWGFCPSLWAYESIIDKVFFF